MIVGNPIITILKAILNWFRLRRDYIANAVDKIPPEIKKSIVAWYDPKKQGMTNYDVIEAYVEDFTDWYKEINNGTVTATNKSFHFTEVKKIGSTSAIVRLVSHRINGEIKLNIKGVTEDNPISFTEYSTTVLTVNKDGVYTLVINDATVGIYFTKVGVVDVTVTQLPTSILKDFSGNGNHAYLYGGKGKLNSGMGLYKVDFTSWRFYPSFNTVEYYHNKLVIKKATDSKNLCAHTFTDKFTAKISNIPDGTNLYYKYYDKINKKNVSILLHNGINEIDYTNADGNIDATNMFIISKDVDFNITIEQIPDYPDQLCYDGKMYAVCYGFPILTDYTVIAERTWFEKEGAFIVKGSSPNYGFVFERFDGDLERVQSLGAWNTITINTDSAVSYLTKNKYNDSNIKNGIGVDEDVLCVGGSYKKETNIGSLLFIGCHGAIIVADRSFTEEEINWLKQNWDKI